MWEINVLNWRCQNCHRPYVDVKLVLKSSRDSTTNATNSSIRALPIDFKGPLYLTRWRTVLFSRFLMSRVNLYLLFQPRTQQPSRQSTVFSLYFLSLKCPIMQAYTPIEVQLYSSLSHRCPQFLLERKIATVGNKSSYSSAYNPRGNGQQRHSLAHYPTPTQLSLTFHRILGTYASPSRKIPVRQFSNYCQFE